MEIDEAPLLRAYLQAVRGGQTPFTIPGHKRAAGRLCPELGHLLDHDVPLYGGLDTVKLTGGVLAQAEARAGTLWGADWCRFSTGGSTHANQALALALGQPGDEVLVARAVHRSTLLGLVLAGLTPVWLPVTVDSRFGIPSGVDPATIRGKRAKAVLVVEPSYLGTVSDLRAIVAEAAAPVVVDQAWGAHFGFHEALPPHALAQGADALVTSAHKTLPAYSQASLALASTRRLDRDRLERAFEAANTTSPAGSILASVDGARALLEARGRELLGELIELVAAARAELSQIEGVLVPGPEDFPPGRFDPTKLVVILAGTGANGNDVERDLVEAGLPVEMADRDTLVPIVTIVDTAETVGRLVGAMKVAITANRGRPRDVGEAVQWGQTAVVAMTPREAFFARHRTVAAAEAVGRVCAEVVAPYPPGVPVLVPGEIIAAETLAGLHHARRSGTRIAYAADPTLATLQVVS